MNNNENFTTSSFYIAVLLLSKNFELKDVIRDDPGKCLFIFDSSPDIQNLADMYRYGDGSEPELKIPITLVEQNIKKLKKIIYG